EAESTGGHSSGVRRRSDRASDAQCAAGRHRGAWPGRRTRTVVATVPGRAGARLDPHETSARPSLGAGADPGAPLESAGWLGDRGGGAPGADPGSQSALDLRLARPDPLHRGDGITRDRPGPPRTPTSEAA